MSFSAAKAVFPAGRGFLLRARTVGKRAGAAIVFLFLLFPHLSRAEIFLEARVGFHGVFQLGRPLPLEVEIFNNGLPAEAVLEVRAWKGGATKGGAPYPVDYRREVFVAAQGRKTVQMTIDPDFISRPLSIRFSSAAGKAVRELDLRRNFSPAPVLLFVSERSALPPIALGPSSANRLVALSLDELPADARALLGVSHLLIYDTSLRDLSRAQINALDTWLMAGGRMVILASLNYALYQEPTLSRFLPVRVSGVKRISYVSAAEGKAKVSIANVWAQTSTVVQGQAVTELEGVPVLVESGRGKGRVTYFAVDIGRPPMSDWAGLPRVLQSLVSPVSADDALPRTQWDDSVFTQLILNPSFIASYVPTGALLLAVALYFAGLGVVTWLWQRKRLVRRQVIIAFTGWMVLSSFGGYWYFSRGGKIPEGVLLVSSVIENNGDSFVEAQSNLALFSTQNRGYDLQPERGWIDLMPLASRSPGPTEPIIVREDGAGTSHYQLPLREWDYRLFRLRSVARLALRAQFEAQGDKLLMKIDNQSGKDLNDCWLVVPGRRYALGDISRGTSWSKTFSLLRADAKEENASSTSDNVNFRELNFTEKTRSILFHSSFFPRDSEAQWNNGAAVFFGWVQNPDPRVRVDDPQIRVQDYALVRAIIPLARGDDE